MIACESRMLESQMPRKRRLGCPRPRGFPALIRTSPTTIFLLKGPVSPLRHSRDGTGNLSDFAEEMDFPAITLSSYAERLIVSYLCYAF
jgi:hypothetical protein